MSASLDPLLVCLRYRKSHPLPMAQTTVAGLWDGSRDVARTALAATGSLPVHEANGKCRHLSSQRGSPTSGGVLWSATHPVDNVYQARNDEVVGMEAKDDETGIVKVA